MRGEIAERGTSAMRMETWPGTPAAVVRVEGNDPEGVRTTPKTHEKY